MLRTAAQNASISLLGLLVGALATHFWPVAAALGPATFEEDGPPVATPAASPAVVDMAESAVKKPAGLVTEHSENPREKTIERTDQPGSAAPAESEPVSAPPAVTIMGPADAMLGDQIYLRAVVTGDASFYRWRVSPAVDGLIVMDGGRSAVFSNRNPGVYRFVCAVSGPGGVELDEAEVEVVDTAGDAAEAPSGPQPAAGMAPAAGPIPVAPMSAAQEQAAFDQRIVVMVERVQSSARVAEAKIVGGVFRMIGEALKAGDLPATEDPLTAIVRQADAALGISAKAWRSFFTVYAQATNSHRATAPRDPQIFLATASALARLQ